MFTVFTRAARSWRHAMRRPIWRTAPLRLHAIHHAIELLDDPVEPAGGVAFAGHPFTDGRIVGA
jgi:hypothetical protein